MANGYYFLDNANPVKLMNWKIAKDVLMHLERIVDQCTLKKLDKRSGVDQAVYAVRKRFGHRSTSPDLYLWHAGMGRNEQFFGGSDDCITATDVDGSTLCYRLWLLGKQSKNATSNLDKSAEPNEIAIFINQARSLNQVNVTLALSGPAMMQLCIDLARTKAIHLMPKIRNMMKAKWGCDGVRFDNVDPEGRKAWALGDQVTDRRKLGQMQYDGEAYLYRRYLNGVAHNWDDGKGWII